MWRSILFSIVLSSGAFQVSAEEEIDAAKSFEDWSVFIDGGDCWISTFFDFDDSETAFDTYYFVTFHQRSPQPSISIALPNHSKRSGVLPVRVGGASYELIIDEGTAFPKDDDEMVIFNKMLKSEPIKFTLNDGSDVSYEASVSYSGFRDAYNYLSRQCEFNFNPDLSDTEGVEPT